MLPKRNLFEQHFSQLLVGSVLSFSLFNLLSIHVMEIDLWDQSSMRWKRLCTFCTNQTAICNQHRLLFSHSHRFSWWCSNHRSSYSQRHNLFVCFSSLSFSPHHTVDSFNSGSNYEFHAFSIYNSPTRFWLLLL